MTGMPLLTDHATAHRVSRAEFERFRDAREHDGVRYELLAGEILVAPAPAPLHQIVSVGLTLLLGPLVEPPLRLLTAPVDVTLRVPDGETVLQPDLVLVRREDITAREIDRVSLLAVEILSPTTWRRDLGPRT